MPDLPNRPTFLGIGAMKAGTTSLYGHLAAHPDVYMAYPKELNFFLDRGNWAKGTRWYADRFAESQSSTARGEVSPSYGQTHLYPEVPGRIAALLPEVRVIFLVRDPIERIKSMYAHLVIDGIERLPIDEAVVANTDYVETSRYIRHLDTYASVVTRERMLVIVSERLRKDPIGQLDDLAEFIGVQPWSELGLTSAPDRNVTASRTVEAPVGVKLKRVAPYWRLLNRSWRARAAHRRIFERAAVVPDTALDDTTEAWLRRSLESDTSRLKQWLGDDLAEWDASPSS